MIPKFEFGHLYKFLVSVGLGLLALSVLGPWFVLRESEVLLTTQAQLDGLTPGARESILDKQRDHGWMVDNYVWISAILAVGGITIVIVGFLGWKKRQDVIDESEKVARDTAVVQLQAMTPAEIDEKQAREAEEVALEAPKADAEREGGVDADNAHPSHGSASTDDFRQTVADIERAVFARLEESFSRTHDVRTNVRLQTSTTGSASIDALLIPREVDGGQIGLVEVKYVRSLAALRNRLADFVFTLTRAVGAPKGGIAPSRACLILVFEDATKLSDRSLEQLREDARSLERGTFMADVGVVIMERRSLSEVTSAAFKRAVLTEGLSDLRS
jgi:hypothetical protein